MRSRSDRLVGLLWSNAYTAAAPVAFKAMMGKVREDFTGYRQHDAHELCVRHRLSVVLPLSCMPFLAVPHELCGRQCLFAVLSLGVRAEDRAP
eukprot:SAG22_NODE_7107_length_775_cov_1.116864_2_plen_92_part_01